jgi:VanZ family protein
VSRRARILLWAPVALLLAYEFYLSSQSRLPTFGILLPHFDKLAHSTYFFLTGTFFMRAARFGEAWTARRSALVLVAGGFLYGCLDEFHQSFVPGRSVEAADVLADTLGFMAAAFLAERLWRRLGLDHVVK